jgi:tetratricopeptide (TPR) repeat protein
VPIAGLVILAAGVVWLQMVREARFPPLAPAQRMLYVSSPKLMTRLALSYRAVLSDLYWIRVVQYYGGTRLSRDPHKNYDLLYPLLDLTTSLDPQFSIAYRFGAFFLAEPLPGGAGRADLAEALLDKAIAANPERWEYPHDVGFVYYRRGDYVRAAEWFRRAAMVPGAPNWLEPVAAVMLAAGGQTDTSRVLWRNLLASTDEAWIRNIGEFRLRQLDTIDAIRALERITAEYRRLHGRAPSRWADLIDAGMLRGVPMDGSGVPLVLDPLTGRVTLDQRSPMWPLPAEQGR